MKTVAALTSTALAVFTSQATGADIGHDQVAPFTQPDPVTISEKAAVKFKPQLHISNGCHPYPAVNEAGDTGGGLRNSGAPSGMCKGSGLGSQVYGRSGWHNDVWAIMYAWYFPKDMASSDLGHRHDWEHAVIWIDNPDVVEPKILAVSVSSHSGYSKKTEIPADSINGTSVLINYESTWPYDHDLRFTTKGGEYQLLIMWEQLTDAAREALSSTDFGKAVMPMTDFRFPGKLDKAWPF
ncbi:Necrosis inducing-like protein NPP1 type [Phytophthora palmivora]|uniref:Necrosis inducing-like protein NPP1 type n=1 Tax=Phytophthora palmivora TaxID=4796 RepID=A0A2P4X8W7_9STRA|nr:Necrosis inducing-like protein NPP1 type [Phytophthora palmivora]